jgi:hypothetical protein
MGLGLKRDGRLAVIPEWEALDRRLDSDLDYPALLFTEPHGRPEVGPASDDPGAFEVMWL